MGDWIVALPMLTPLVGAVVALLVPRRWRGAVGSATAAGFALCTAAFAARVFGEGPQRAAVGGWPEPFGIVLVGDGAAALLLCVAAVVVVATAVYSRSARTSAPLWFVVAGAAGAVLAGDLFNLYVWFEVMIFASIAVLVQRSSHRDHRTIRVYVVVNLIASALLLTGVGLVYGATGTVHMAGVHRALSALDPALGAAIAAVFAVALAVKAGAFPVFSWMPAAYATLPPAQVALFSALLTKVAVVALIRLGTGPLASAWASLQPVLVAVACATMVAGVLCALAQMDLRRLLAFHIVSQVGYLLLAIALDTDAAALGFFFFIAHVACAKAALFLVAGIVAREGGAYDLRRLGGLARRRPAIAALFGVSALALAGLPPLSGFWGKLFVIQAGLDSQAWIAVGVALGVSALTLLSMLKIWLYAFWRPAPAEADDQGGRLARADIAPTGWLPLAGAGMLAAATVIVGLVPGPLYAAAALAVQHLGAGSVP